MRQVLSAVLLSVMIIVAPLAPLAGADVAKEPPKHPAPALVSIASPIQIVRLAYKAVRAHHPAVVSPLAATARVAGTTIGALRAEWQRVAVCEVGGNWAMTGPRFSGIGFANSTWDAFGGRRFASLAGIATIDQQIFIGMKVTGGWVPDQNGCSRGGW